MLNKTQYQILAMTKGNCTEHIPVKVFIAGTEKIGYLDPKDNVINPNSFTVNCANKRRVLMRVEGATHSYHYNGTVTLVNNTASLLIPDINLGSKPIKIEETIFSRAHRLNWADQDSHHSLNQMFATLDRQKTVLTAMGMISSSHNTLGYNVIESRENILGSSYFSFLFGGHVANAYELWTLACNITITITVGLAIIGSIVEKCCIPRYRQ